MVEYTTWQGEIKGKQAACRGCWISNRPVASAAFLAMTLILVIFAIEQSVRSNPGGYPGVEL
jgi:hypothetical protein